MNKETKATDKIGLVKTNLISIRVTSPFFVTWDPNFHRIRELKPILDLLLILCSKGTQDVLSFIGVDTEVASETTRSSDENSPVLRSLDLTSNIFNNPATLVEWETRGNYEEMREVYGQSSPTKKLILSRHSPSTNSSKLPKWVKKRAIEGQFTLTAK